MKYGKLGSKAQRIAQQRLWFCLWTTQHIDWIDRFESQSFGD